MGIIDIIEENIVEKYGEDVLQTLLLEHAYDYSNNTTSKHHIFWATDNYKNEGSGFQFSDEIQISNITGKYNCLVRPRADKSKEEQEKRTHDKAEVFTPSWICNAQNNMIDEAWFGYANIFNIVNEETCTWEPTKEKIKFPNTKGKTWKDYVCDTRLEMACGEAPYLVSRYDTTTGEPIPLDYRIGLLDRKFRVVGENVTTLDDWFQWAFAALKSTYGFEWQGDNLLLAREAILYSFIDYYEEFTRRLTIEQIDSLHPYLLYASKIISWNIFQMDGIKMVLPSTCKDTVVNEPSLIFEEAKVNVTPCPGCKNNNIHLHNGIRQVIADWKKDDWNENEEPVEVVEFHTLIKY